MSEKSNIKLNTNSRFLVGIDLGTTNSAISFFDTLEQDKDIQTLDIPQWHSESMFGHSTNLPSFCLIPLKNEVKKGKYNLPSDPEEYKREIVVGNLAKEAATTQPARVVSSAKSWLCHEGVDRESAILPWTSDEIIGSKRISPVEASSYFLAHLKDVWNDAKGKNTEEYHLENQNLVITVPASFDETAQRLTLKSAELAGFKRDKIRLLEEPQAAFYHWVSEQKQSNEKNSPLLKIFTDIQDTEKTILICDIGGGTTDFSLFSIKPPKSKQELQEIHRVKVGDHILIGGDNIDLHIAHILEIKIEKQYGKKLTSPQWAAAVAQSRLLKEKALNLDLSNEKEEFFISIPGSGSSLFAQAVTASITLEEIKDIIISGFFPLCEKSCKTNKKQSAVVEWGLDYPIDSAITKHLAEFLNQQPIDGVMFTGGSLKPQFIQNRILTLLQSWQETPIINLENSQMDFAVCLGASEYNKALVNNEGKFQGGYSRSLYIAAADRDNNQKLICIIPKGFDQKKKMNIDNLNLNLRVGEAASFYLFYSNNEVGKVGQVISYSPEKFKSLPPLETKLNAPKEMSKKLISVGIEAIIEDTGLLELKCYSKENPELIWSLNFQTSSSSLPTIFSKQNGKQIALPKDRFQLAIDTIDTFFGKNKKNEKLTSPSQIMKYLEKEFGKEKKEWELPLLRELWNPLKNGINRRSRSATHEMSWLNMVGYSLRPGFGMNLDSFRIEDLWDIFQQGMNHPSEAKVKDQWWIMWRRVAGGLNQDQQNKLFTKLFPTIKRSKDITPEMYMLIGSLERIPLDSKIQLGNILVEQILSGKKQALEQKIWALARVASRQPLYGGVHCVVRPSFVEKWFTELRHVNCHKKPYNKLNQFFSQASRKVNDREFDVSDPMRIEFLKKLRESNANDNLIKVVEEVVIMDTASKELLFGESLPPGFSL